MPIGFSWGKDTKKTDQQFWTPEQQQLSKTLGPWLQSWIGQGATPYGGQFVAGPSKYEQGALDWLNKYMGKTPATYGQAEGAVSRALTGDYKDIIDPTATEKFYGAIEKDVLKRILPKTTENLAQNANLAGVFRSGRHAQTQLENVADITSRLGETLAGLRHADEQTRREIARERERRQIEAVPLTGMAANLPLQQVQAGLTYGALPRQLEQKGLESRFQEFLRTLPENNPLLQLMMSYLSQKGQMTGESAGRSKSLGLSLQ